MFNSLTRQERIVLIFLVVSFLLGLSINWGRKHKILQPFGLQDDHSGNTKKNSSSGQLNLNKATNKSLIELPGIGEAIAERIIEYRQEYGEFKSLEELRNIEGIGEKKLARIRNLLTVE